METRNILLTGVGGQGTILVSKILTIGLMSEGYDVKMSEVHGMSQREGPVLTHVRFGDKVYSPVVERKKADLIIGFEELEVLRNLEYLREDGAGFVIFNRTRVNPIGVQNGSDKYPETIEKLVYKKTAHVYIIDAAQEARKLGNARAMNMILLGTAVKLLKLDKINWKAIIAENLKRVYLEINQQAFQLGLDHTWV